MRFSVSILALIIATGLNCYSADSAPQVVLSTAKTGPRAVEPLTQRAIMRDYKFAWANLADALQSNSTAPLNGLFAGTAEDWLQEIIQNQRSSGLTSRYLNQMHKLEGVFYAPEGDMIELHDTAEYDLQISDGERTVHNQHTVVRYVVLMTPGADRWVIRQLQSVPEF